MNHLNNDKICHAKVYIHFAKFVSKGVDSVLV